MDNKIMSFFKTEKYLLCPIGIINRCEHITLFEVRLPEQRDLRMDVIKRVLNYMKELRRWFTLTDDRRVQIRLVEFLDCLPIGAYNDLKVQNLQNIQNIQNIIEDEYDFFVGDSIHEKNESSDEFNVNVCLMLMQ